MKNKLLFALLALILILNSSFFIHADDETSNENEYYYSPGVEVNPQPSLKMSSDGIISMSAGEERDVEIKIKNVSSFYAYNVLIQATSGSSEVPFTLEYLDKSNIKYFLQSTVAMTTKLRFKVDKDAKAGTYPIVLNYSYTSINKTAFTGTDTVYLKIDNKLSTPSVTISKFDINKNSINAGDTFKISANVSSANAVAKDVTILIDGLTPTTLGMQNGSSTIAINELYANEDKELSFHLNTHKDMKTGSYPITFKLSYKDSTGKEYTKDYGYSINVIAQNDSQSSEKADLQVTLTGPSETYNINQVFSIGVKVKNISNKDARNITISTIENENMVIVPRSTSVAQISNLKPGEERTLTFQFSSTDEAITKNYSIGFDVEYETGILKEDLYETKKFKQFSGVNIYNPTPKKNNDDKTDDKISKPKIIISRYVSTPVMVEAGEKFDLTMTFKNTHPTKSVENVKLYITVDEKTEEKGNVFTPDNASNTFYINKIAPRGEVNHTFKMFTVPDAQPRTYTIIVNFEYEDSLYNEYQSQELVGINVRQAAELGTSDIVTPTSGTVGEPSSIMFELYNTGKVDISNLMIKIVGDNFDTSQSNIYIGDFIKGNSDYYEGVFFPNVAGTSTGKLIISYDEASGEKVEKITDFTMDISEKPISVDAGNAEQAPVPTANNHTKLKIGLGIAIALALVTALFIIIRKRIKIRRDRELDE